MGERGIFPISCEKFVGKRCLLAAILILKILSGINDPKQQKDTIAIVFLKKRVTFVSYIILIIYIIY